MPDLRFNLSHTSGAALIGVGVGPELGVDIEWQRPMDDLNAIARCIMSAEELTLWQTLAPGDRPRVFYQVWTRKESYLKAIGLGLYRDPREVTVPVSADLLLLSTRQSGIVRDRDQNGVWRVADIAASEGYSASICCEGEGMPEIIIREFEFDDIS
jgi:4'-phosphopantetheinyl transferase